MGFISTNGYIIFVPVKIGSKKHNWLKETFEGIRFYTFNELIHQDVLYGVFEDGDPNFVNSTKKLPKNEKPLLDFITQSNNNNLIYDTEKTLFYIFGISALNYGGHRYMYFKLEDKQIKPKDVYCLNISFNEILTKRRELFLHYLKTPGCLINKEKTSCSCIYVKPPLTKMNDDDTSEDDMDDDTSEDDMDDDMDDMDDDTSEDETLAEYKYDGKESKEK